MSAITLQDGSTVGDVVLVNRSGVIYYGIAREIDNQSLTNVKVEVISGTLESYPIWVYGSDVCKLTEEVVTNRRQQLTTELQELEAAWEVARYK